MFLPLILFSAVAYIALDALNFRLRKKSFILRAPFSAFQLFFGFIGFWYMRPVLQAYGATHKILAAALVAAIIYLAWRARGYSPAARVWLAGRWLFIIGLPVAMIWFFVFYISQDNCRGVMADPRVRPLLTTCDPRQIADLKLRFPEINWGFLFKRIQPRCIFLSTVPGLAYLGTGNEEAKAPNQILALVDRKTHRVLRVKKLPAVFRGYCDPATRRCTASLSATNQLFVFDDGAGKDVKLIRTPARPRFMLAPPGGRTLIFGSDRDPIASVFDLDKMEVTTMGYNMAHYRGVATPCPGDAVDMGMTFVAYNSRSRELNITPECPLLNTLLIRSDTALQHVRHFNLGLAGNIWGYGYIMGMEIDPELNELYLSAVTDGSIFIYDYSTLKLKKKIRLGVGIRETSYDQRRHLLFAGQYVDGYLYVIDTRRKTVRDRIFIGKRSRQILYDPATKHVLATSANGFFEVDVSAY